MEVLSKPLECDTWIGGEVTEDFLRISGDEITSSPQGKWSIPRGGAMYDGHMVRESVFSSRVFDNLI